MNNYPLVSILIPTHNRPAYFDLALNSALAQDYPNIEIIVSDNSTNDHTEKLIQKYLSDKRIHYKRNVGFSGTENWLYIINNAHGIYFNLLCDDDIIFDSKISTMVGIYKNNPNISIVTSYRKRIDENNNILPDIGINKPILQKTGILSGTDMANYMIKNVANLIGEFSSTLLPFDKELLNKVFAIKDGINCDVRIYLELCKKGDTCYITDPLSCFRQHPGNDQNNLITHFLALIDWHNILNQYKKDYPYSLPASDYEQLLSDLVGNAAITLWKINNHIIDFNNISPKELELKLLSILSPTLN